MQGEGLNSKGNKDGVVPAGEESRAKQGRREEKKCKGVEGGRKKQAKGKKKRDLRGEATSYL